MINRNRRITLREVARQAGVSMGTASQSLIDNPNSTIKVSAKTRDRVVEVAEKMKYRHNRAAQVLRQGKSGMIGIIECQGRDQGMAEQRVHASNAVTVAGLTPYPFRVNLSDPKARVEACNRMMDAHVDGVLSLVPQQGFDQEQIDRLQECGIPVVVCSRPNFERVPLFVSDVAAGAELLTRHMLGQRPGSIALLTRGSRAATGIWQMWYSESITRGFFAACGKQPVESAIAHAVHYINNPLPPCILEPADTLVADFSHGYAAARMLCEADALPGALVCESDDIAMGVLRACAEEGIAVPQDMLIAGYGNADYSSVGTIPLTTLAPNHGEVYRRAVDVLASLIEGKRRRITQPVWIRGRVVVRQSSMRRRRPQPKITIARQEFFLAEQSAAQPRRLFGQSPTGC